MEIFEIKGQPMGKQRPKFTRMGNYTKTYTPKETVNYETFVRLCYQNQCKECFGKKPLSIHIKAYYKIPTSYSFKKKMQCYSGDIRPITKPDADNIAKIICDSLNGIAYDDDKQIVTLLVEKYYTIEPRVVVTLKEIYDVKGNSQDKDIE